jgi:hypothetical protein
MATLFNRFGTTGLMAFATTKAWSAWLTSTGLGSRRVNSRFRPATSYSRRSSHTAYAQGGRPFSHAPDFDKHLQFIQPQVRYFNAMSALSPQQVAFLDAGEPNDLAESVELRLRDHPSPRPSSLELFDHMARWLASSSA